MDEGNLFRHVVVAVDGTDASARALSHGVRVARASNALLDLVAVSPVNSTTQWGGATQPIALLDRPWAEVLRRAASSIDDLPVTTYLVKGDPAKAIVSHARDHDCDLIVMGSRGRARATAAVLGSTALEVIHRATVPVFVVHGNGARWDDADAVVPATTVGA
jgi:nucleotide-binding universal stress UspA family protein